MGPYSSAPAPIPGAPLPAPQPLNPMPQPSFLPGFGIDPAEQLVLQDQPSLYGYAGVPMAPAPVAGTASASSTALAQALAALTNGGLTTDPRTWDPSEAQQQTDNALARIGQANPELAQALAEQNEQVLSGQEEDKGFFGTLMGGLGKVMEVTHLDDVFEVLSRPAHILPEVIMDWGKESVWNNAGDALSGHSDVSWDDVLVDKLGMERNIFTAALGLVGDIALDPLTYIPLGRLAGLGRETTTAAAGKAVSVASTREAAEIVAAKAGGATVDDLVAKGFSKVAVEDAEFINAFSQKAFQQMDETLAIATKTDTAGVMAFAQSDVAAQAAAQSRKGMLSKMTTQLKGVDPDAIPGVVNLGADVAARRGLEILTARANSVMLEGFRGNLSKVPAEFAEKLGWSKKGTDAVLKDWVQAGTGFKGGAAGKGLYTRGKEAATQLGGWRFQLNIPVLGLRVAPHRILPKLVPQLDFGMARRFFTGISGHMKFQRLATFGGAREMAAYKTFIERGFRETAELYPDIAKTVGGWHGHFGSVASPFMAASERMGKATARFSPHAAAMRNGGLGGYRAAQLSREGHGIERSFIEEMGRVERFDGSTMGQQGVLDLANKEWSKLGTEEAQQLSDDLEEWADLVPATQRGSSVDELMKGLSPQQRVGIEPRLRELEASMRARGDNSFELAEMLRQQADNVERIKGANGVSPEYDRFGFVTRDDLTPGDAARAASQSEHAWAQDQVWEAGGDVDVSALETIGDDALEDVTVHGHTARGMHLKSSRTGLAGPVPDNTKALMRSERNIREAEAQLMELRLNRELAGPEYLKALEAGQAKVAKARAEEAVLTRRSQELVFHGNGILTLDLSAGGTAADAGSAGMDIAGDVEARIRPVAEAFQGAAKEVDEAAEAAMDPGLRSIAARLRANGGNIPSGVTTELQGMGHNGLRIITDDGQELIVFRNADGTIPVARITEGAPGTVSGGGSRVRAATTAAYDAVRRSKLGKDSPGGSKTWLDRLVRSTTGLSRREAEEKIRLAMEAEGVALVEGQAVLENNFLNAIQTAQRAGARQIKSRIFGNSARTLENLGLTGSVLSGGLVGFQRSRFVPPPSLEKVKDLANDIKAQQSTIATFHKEQVRELDELATAATEQLERHYEALRQMRDGLDTATYERLMGGAAKHPVPREAAAEFAAARAEGRATDLGDGLWEVTDPVDASRMLVSTTRRGNDATPMGGYRVGDEEVVLYHFTDDAKLESVGRKGINESVKGEGAGKVTPAVYAYDEQTAMRMMAEGVLDESDMAKGFKGGVGRGRSAVAFRARADSVEHLGSDGVRVPGRVDANRILGTHAAGEEVIDGIRVLDKDGKLTLASEAPGSKGVRPRLLDEDLRIAGVTEAEEPVVAMAEFMRTRGVAGRLERNRAGKLADNLEGTLHTRVRTATDELELRTQFMNEDLNEVTRLRGRLNMESATPRPALQPVTPSSLSEAGMERIDDIPGFGDTLMPTFMAQEFRRAVEGNPVRAHNAFRAFNAWWKSYATWVNPGFHVRNIYGAFFNNWLGGVDIADYVMTRRIRSAAHELADAGKPGKWATKTLIEGGDNAVIEGMKRNGQLQMLGKNVDDLTYGDMAAMTASMGVTGGNGATIGRANESLLQRLDNAEGKKLLIERTPGARRYAEAMKGLGTGTENVMRTAAMMRGLKTYGTIPESRAFTMLRHGDYEDLTDFEFNIVRDVIPFYKWMRTNTPLQVHQLLESPAKLLAVQKAQGAVFTAVGRDYDEDVKNMPEWMGDSFVIPLSSKEDAFESVMLDFPMSDIHMGVRDFMSSALPLVQPFFENYITNEETFTGAPLTNERIALPTVFGLPGIKQLLDVTSFAEEGADGRMYTTDKNANLLGLAPFVGRFKSFIFESSTPHATMNSIVSASMGVQLRKVDEQAMSSRELEFYYGQVVPAMDHLREMGYPLPTTSDIEAMAGSVDTALIAMGIAPRLEAAPTLASTAA